MLPSYNGLFQANYKVTTYFDEGPNVRVNSHPVNSSSLDTSAIDGYRQGVELTSQKFFDAGFVKIHVGEPGHILRQANFGDFTRIQPHDTFCDPQFPNTRDPVSYVKMVNKPTHAEVVIPGTTDIYRLLDGVLEPFSISPHHVFIRSRNSFIKDAAQFHGNFEQGNLDATNASDRVLSVDYFDLDLSTTAFVDSTTVQVYDAKSKKSVEAPYSDARYIRNADTTSEGTSMDAALSLMSGSTDNYVSFKQLSAATGWYYDLSVSQGTDSISFGGMTY